MTHPLIIRPEAEQDMAEGRDWYEGQREGLGIEFLTAVDHVFDRIGKNPKLCPPKYHAVRRAALGRFPFVVYYRIIAEVVEWPPCSTAAEALGSGVREHSSLC